MDDLIILIIQAIARLLKVDPPSTPPRTPVAGAIAPPPVVRRRVMGRRPVPPPIPAGRRPAVPVRPPAVVEEKVVPGSAGSHTSLNPAAKSVDTATSIRALLTPSMLQKQFILTEIFQPPVALRE